MRAYSKMGTTMLLVLGTLFASGAAISAIAEEDCGVDPEACYFEDAVLELASTEEYDDDAAACGYYDYDKCGNVIRTVNKCTTWKVVEANGNVSLLSVRPTGISAGVRIECEERVTEQWTYDIYRSTPSKSSK